MERAEIMEVARGVKKTENTRCEINIHQNRKGGEVGMIDCNKVIKDIEYAKDLLQNRPEQDTVDYKVWEVLDDALDLINDLRSQIAMLVAVQHTMAEIMGEKQDRINIEQTLDETYGVTGGLCPTCGNWIQSAHSFCGFCGQPIGWKKQFSEGR